MRCLGSVLIGDLQSDSQGFIFLIILYSQSFKLNYHLFTEKNSNSEVQTLRNLEFENYRAGALYMCSGQLLSIF